MTGGRFFGIYGDRHLNPLETKTVKSGMYIKIRTYKKVGKKTYYSEWTTPVKVK